jgi:hypothetical protein
MKPNRKMITPFAVMVQTVQYALAGYFLIGWLGVITVGLMGGLVSFAMAYGSSQFNDIAKNRKPSALVALVVLMAFSPVLIGTATYLHLTNIPNPVWRGVVAAVWGLLPDLSVALSGFIAGKGLFDHSDGKKKGGKPVPVAGKPGKKGGKVASKGKTVAEQEPPPDMTDEALYQFVAEQQAKDPKGKRPSHAKIAKHFGVTRQAVGPRLKKLAEHYAFKMDGEQ